MSKNKNYMQTIRSLLATSREKLKNAQIPSYSLDADLLMSHVLKISKAEIFCYPMRTLSQNEEQHFNELVQRRVAREPMSHILGIREFWGREFIVNKNTLDPRPDSESLIEQVLELYDNNPPAKILDLGTGTGCLLLTLLSEFTDSEGVGADISEAAISVAKENSLKLGLAKRSSFVVSNWGKSIKGNYNLIISNPPYIKYSDIEGLEPEVSKYEPIQALDGGNTGLECYIELAPQIFNLLSEGGFAVLEHGIGQETAIREILENNNLSFVNYKQDLAGINRCITVRKNKGIC